ncbi:MAG: trypsin-like peptidase domain-containing protein [Candidatus Levybacteria bacterium]|nr:trypsin-like peptidase domain-containing protein [Candidatus Levybacteria bacterium]
MRRFIVLIAIILILVGIGSALEEYTPFFRDYLNSVGFSSSQSLGGDKVRVVSEESVVIDVVKKVGPSVVTVAATSQVSIIDRNDPFSIFGFPSPNTPSRPETQNIGSGFIVTSDGLIVTNKHVVSDPEAKYTVITASEKKYSVERVFRDPLNDIAILKIDPSQNAGEKLSPVTLGDSSKLQVGQLAIAIGTPLGEFSNSVTKGIVSGLGRGIVAGSPFEGFVERLDDVIQTDAAISPGNSGGPLLSSEGQVIGVNTAVSQNGENIGFALPINLVKERMDEFNSSGQFNRAYVGVSYKMISRQLALQNDVPEGAYVQTVVEGSPAAVGGIREGDIITHIDGTKIEPRNNDLSKIIATKKVGQQVAVKIWREDENGNADTSDIKITLGNATEQ